MKYNHYSELPIGAFEPICGRMKLYGGGGNPIQAISDAVSNIGESISNAVSDVGGTIGDLGNQIDQSVNSAVPGGWATVGAAALAAATLGGSLAADGLAVAPELDATGTLAEQGAALQGTTVGAGLTDTGLSMIPPDTPPPITDTGLSMIPPETPVSSTGAPIYDYSPTTAVTNASPELDATGSMSQQALQAPVIDMSPNTPVQNVSPELDSTGSMATGTSASDIANALRAMIPPDTFVPDVSPPAPVENLAPEPFASLSPEPPPIAPEPFPVVPQDLADALRSEGTANLGQGTSLSANASDPLNSYYSTANPTVQANTGTVSNLVGGGAESNLATLDSLSNPLVPTSGAGIGGSELGATGSIIGSGQGLGVQTLPETLAPTGLNGLTVNDLNSQPLLNNGTNSSITGKDVADALRAANNANNLIKNLTSSQQKLASNQQNLQQSQALGNLLKANQFTPTATPPIYKAQNPFTFGQQELIQGNPLASLLRNNYGNS
jgi:hypothetical protein